MANSLWAVINGIKTNLITPTKETIKSEGVGVGCQPSTSLKACSVRVLVTVLPLLLQQLKPDSIPNNHILLQI